MTVSCPGSRWPPLSPRCQSNRASLARWTSDGLNGCTADKLAATVWFRHVNTDQNPVESILLRTEVAMGTDLLLAHCNRIKQVMSVRAWAVSQVQRMVTSQLEKQTEWWCTEDSWKCQIWRKTEASKKRTLVFVLACIYGISAVRVHGVERRVVVFFLSIFFFFCHRLCGFSLSISQRGPSSLGLERVCGLWPGWADASSFLR